MTGGLVAGLVAGYGVALPVGAIATYLVSIGAGGGLRIAICAALGVATADGMYAGIAAFGGAWLQSFLAPVSDALTCAAAAVLAILAARTMVTAIRRYVAAPAAEPVQRAPRGLLRAYAGLLALTVLNPSTLAYFSALVLGDRSSSGGRMAASVFTVGAFLASASWQVFLATSGAALRRVVTGRGGQLIVGAASSTVMVVLAIRLFQR